MSNWARGDLGISRPAARDGRLHPSGCQGVVDLRDGSDAETGGRWLGTRAGEVLKWRPVAREIWRSSMA